MQRERWSNSMNDWANCYLEGVSAIEIDTINMLRTRIYEILDKDYSTRRSGKTTGLASMVAALKICVPNIEAEMRKIEAKNNMELAKRLLKNTLPESKKDRSKRLPPKRQQPQPKHQKRPKQRIK